MRERKKFSRICSSVIRVASTVSLYMHHFFFLTVVIEPSGMMNPIPIPMVSYSTFEMITDGVQTILVVPSVIWSMSRSMEGTPGAILDTTQAPFPLTLKLNRTSCQLKTS
jgi:hypothetical protein